MLNPKGYGGHAGFPLGFAVLASILKQDFSIQIVDANRWDLNPHETKKMIEAFNPKIVCLTGMWSHSDYLCKLSNLLREDIVQIAGGWWASPIPEMILETTKVSYVVVGEADDVITGLCKDILK